MAWYDEAIFYHIYPLGLTGAPQENDHLTVHRLKALDPWVDHLEQLGITALYIGPLFESVGHGYETTDYYKVDSRLGDNEDLKMLVARCHEKGIRVILDGVFNHVGRDFFAFKDLQARREHSRYRDWFCNVNFWGNNSYNDGFSYENWGGYDLLVKLNQRHPEVRQYLFDAVRFWISEFDIDGLRLDAADVLDLDFMKALRQFTEPLKPDFWLMGEVIHGEYSRWVNDSTLHAVTNYALHKALYSGHNDHNYFEIAHTIDRLQNMGSLKLYNFVDNHDVERIMSKLHHPAHYLPVHVLLFTLPGIPSIYYGSEFGIEGKKERFSDASLRPQLNLSCFKQDDPCVSLIRALCHVRQQQPALAYGGYKQLLLTNRQYAFARNAGEETVLVTVNNGEQEAVLMISAEGHEKYIGALTGREIISENGNLAITLPACSGEIWIPEEQMNGDPARFEGLRFKMEEAPAAPQKDLQRVDYAGIPYEQMTVEQLQTAILDKMAANGPVTDQMKKTVTDNIWHDSLVNWVKSFR